MAGGNSVKYDPKKPKKLGDFGNEVINDQNLNHAPPAPVKFSLKGILGLGQTVEFSSGIPKTPEKSWSISHLEQEQKILFDQRQVELKKALEELRNEIKNLALNTKDLQQDVEMAVLSEIVDASEYQISFFIRIRSFIISIRENISEAGLWIQAFAAKKKKRNYFWNTANNKKKGGTQFMFSDESSVSRNG